MSSEKSFDPRAAASALGSRTFGQPIQQNGTFSTSATNAQPLGQPQWSNQPQQRPGMPQQNPPMQPQMGYSQTWRQPNQGPQPGKPQQPQGSQPPPRYPQNQRPQQPLGQPQTSRPQQTPVSQQAPLQKKVGYRLQPQAQPAQQQHRPQASTHASNKTPSRMNTSSKTPTRVNTTQAKSPARPNDVNRLSNGMPPTARAPSVPTLGSSYQIPKKTNPTTSQPRPESAQSSSSAGSSNQPSRTKSPAFQDFRPQDQRPKTPSSRANLLPNQMLINQGKGGRSRAPEMIDPAPMPTGQAQGGRTPRNVNTGRTPKATIRGRTPTREHQQSAKTPTRRAYIEDGSSTSSDAPTDHDKSWDGSPPKKRGRPPGSKNKPKTPSRTPSVGGDITEGKSPARKAATGQKTPSRDVAATSAASANVPPLTPSREPIEIIKEMGEEFRASRTPGRTPAREPTTRSARHATPSQSARKATPTQPARRATPNHSGRHATPARDADQPSTSAASRKRTATDAADGAHSGPTPKKLWPDGQGLMQLPGLQYDYYEEMKESHMIPRVQGFHAFDKALFDNMIRLEDFAALMPKHGLMKRAKTPSGRTPAKTPRARTPGQKTPRR